jgi:hypothetical protein
MRGAGCLVRTEQRICPDNGRKSDVATNHNPLGPTPLHIDCMVTSVHEENGEILSNAKALLQGRAAERMDINTRLTTMVNYLLKITFTFYRL